MQLMKRAVTCIQMACNC